jgi:hypothetical protein
LLADCWQETALHEGEVRQILARLDGVRQQLPVAIKQAHERIIGDRQVANRDKVLSLYEADVQVITSQLRSQAFCLAAMGISAIYGVSSSISTLCELERA